VIGSFDSYRIEQVVTNLFTNAIKYAAGKPVRVGLRQEGDWAHIEVQDHGIGIAPSDQERIFNRFERGVTPQHVSGLGIGLYIAQAIMTAHGGEIAVASREGHGATFTIKLPLQSRPL
jgi:signal transduction histidine kinase